MLVIVGSGGAKFFNHNLNINHHQLYQDGYLNDGFLAPTDYRVSGTISTLNDVFNSMFPINGQDTANGYGGILYGRYAGLVWAGFRFSFSPPSLHT